VPIGRAEVVREGTDILFVGFGPIVARALEAADTLEAESNDPNLNVLITQPAFSSMPANRISVVAHPRCPGKRAYGKMSAC
jgi:deoxyxylulose-5-phosphate synthase